MKKRIIFFWSAGFSDSPAINATVFIEPMFWKLKSSLKFNLIQGFITISIQGYNTDWLNTVRGQSKIVLKPKTTEEVAELVGHCVRRKLAICPQGGNTGLVGGSVPVFDEVIISTNLMDKIEGKWFLKTEDFIKKICNAYS